MNNIGIIKEFDKLGRLVIPKELRERYALNNQVEIVATREGVLIKSPEYVLAKRQRESRKTAENEDNVSAKEQEQTQRE